MTSEFDASERRVLTDQDGKLYLVPRGLADDLRVPEAVQAAVQAALAAGDVRGFALGDGSVGQAVWGTLFAMSRQHGEQTQADKNHINRLGGS